MGNSNFASTCFGMVVGLLCTDRWPLSSIQEHIPSGFEWIIIVHSINREWHFIAAIDWMRMTDNAETWTHWKIPIDNYNWWHRPPSIYEQSCENGWIIHIHVSAGTYVVRFVYGQWTLLYVRHIMSSAYIVATQTKCCRTLYVTSEI